jgi:quinol monooxygenase YgiN
MENPIRVVARISVRPDKLTETLQTLGGLITATRVEDGCVTYELLQNVEDPLDLTFVEEWASPEALQAHFETEHFKAVAAKAGYLLTAPPDIRRYVVLV